MRGLRKQRGFWNFILPAAISAVGSFIGGERRNEAQEAQSEAQMAFQERMSSTAHQREVADLKAAGLNPMLSARLGGASSPAGSQAQLQDTLTPAVNTAMAGATTKANLDLIAAQTEKAKEEAEEVRTKAAINRVEVPFRMQQIAEVDARTRLHGASASELANREMLQLAQKVWTDAQTNRTTVQNALDAQRERNLITEQQREALEFFFRTQDWNKVQSERDAWGSWYGKNVMPYSQNMNFLGHSADSFGRLFRGRR